MASRPGGKIVSCGFSGKYFEICVEEEGWLYFYAWDSADVREGISGEYVLPGRDGYILGITPELCERIPGAHELIRISAPHVLPRRPHLQVVSD